ncbi:hypothetical protein L1765_05280 [Microaerobacter geothermalis]|uniref:hypothetical protein n=1 Tax=Microaerobacter geothermalis TaxID=674972 RepID=UPI001F2A05FD|nr:hypothetical protein [Microaerobacter geothermalis]MCF6093409.1 hypothetical protein [Microaerobacter geothermalis]
MKKKKCPSCGKTSYGSRDENWHCPYCGKDISDVPSEPVEGDMAEIHDILSEEEIIRILKGL